MHLEEPVCASHPQSRLGDIVQKASSSCATGDAPVHDRRVAFFKWLPLLLLIFFAQALFPFIHMLIRTGVHPHALAVCCREARTTPTSGSAYSCRRRVSIFIAPPSRRRLGSRISLSIIRVFPVPQFPERLRPDPSTWVTIIDFLVHIHKLAVQVFPYRSLDASAGSLADCMSMLIHKRWLPSAVSHLGVLVDVPTSTVRTVNSSATSLMVASRSLC